MQFIPADAYQYLQMMSGMGIPTPVISGSANMAEYEGWTYTTEAYTKDTVPSYLTTANFYLVLAFPQGDFADKIDIHPDLPMMVPTSGTTPPILGVFADEKAAAVAMDKDNESVHLMYKLKLRGDTGVREFLEFMATHDMMDVQGNR